MLHNLRHWLSDRSKLAVRWAWKRFGMRLLVWALLPTHAELRAVFDRAYGEAIAAMRGDMAAAKSAATERRLH